MSRNAFLCLLAASSALAIPAQAPPASVTNWTFSGSVQGVMWDEDCKFTIDAAHKITGTCKILQNEYPVTGVIDGNKLTFTHASDYQGDRLTLNFSGKIAADGTATGDIDVEPNGVAGTFTGKPKTTK